jgi:hypothetical protein
MIVKYGIYKNSYNIASMSYEMLPDVARRLFQTVSVKHILSLEPFLDIFKFESNNDYDIDKIFKKFNIYPLNVDEVLGFMKHEYSKDPENALVAEQILGATGTLPDLYQEKYARIAWERFHMDSTSKFIVGDSFSEILKAIIIVGYSTIGNELTEEQKSKVQSSLDRLVEIYGDVDYCIDKLDEYSAGLLSMMTHYKSVKNQVLIAEVSEDIWL